MAGGQPLSVADALKYGPQTQNAIARSRLLQQALESNQQGTDHIGGYGDLAARLAAQGLLTYAQAKNNKALAAALKGEADADTAKYMGMLGGNPATPSAPAMPGLMSQQNGPGAPPITSSPLPPPPAPPGTGDEISAVLSDWGQTPDAQSKDLLAKMMVGEARGEGAPGMMAVGNVALNRARMAKQPLTQVLMAPHQFEGLTSPAAKGAGPGNPAYDKASALADALMRRQAPDNTGGADHFYSPGAQAALGRAPPAWDNGSGTDIGRQRFFALGYGGAKPGQAPPQQMAAQEPQTPMPMGGGPPMSAPPQMPPQPQQMAPQQASYQQAPQQPPQAPPQPANPLAPTEQERQIAMTLLSDPQTHDEGIAYVKSLAARAAAPQKYEVTTVNGAPMAYNPYAPGQQGPTMAVGPQFKTRNLSPEEARAAGYPTGVVAQETPTGNQNVAYTPPAGFHGQGDNLAPIPGGPQDPRAGLNAVSGEKQLRSEYQTASQPYNDARVSFQKVKAAAQDNTGASDIALVYAFMKTLDPGSTVREGEFATAQNSGSIPDTIANLYNKALKGERLQPSQRQGFATTAEHQFGIYEARQREIDKRYSDMAQSYGYNPYNIIQRPGGDGGAGQSGAAGGNGRAPGNAGGQNPQSRGPATPPSGAQWSDADKQFHVRDKFAPHASFPVVRQAADGKWYYKSWGRGGPDTGTWVEVH